MKTSFRIIAATAFLFVASLFTPAQAAVVTPTSSVTFEFDVSGLGAATFTSFSYSCSTFPLCNTGGGRLLSGASFTMDFGTFAGGSDIGTSSFVNPFGFAINNVGAGLIPSQSVAAMLNSVFVTFNYVDDAFGIDVANIRDSLGNITLGGTLISAVPLPAGMLLLVGALGGLGVVSRRARKRHA